MSSFEEYWPQEKFQKDETLITAPIRINQKNYEEAYVAHPDDNGDVLVCGMKMRNRSLNGDVVCLQVLPWQQWKVPLTYFKNNDLLPSIDSINLNGNLHDNNNHQVHSETVIVGKGGDSDNTAMLIKNNMADRYTTFVEIPSLSLSLQKYFTDPSNGRPLFSTYEEFLALYPMVDVVRTGKVVAIAQNVHSRRAAGSLRLMKDKVKNKALFIPRDSRVPRVVVLSKHLPDQFFIRPTDFEKSLFIIAITKWTTSSNMPLGEIYKGVGEVGEVGPETEAILLEYGVDYEEFSQEVMDSLIPLSRTILPEELANRRDFREKCVFTIDPDTAKDLDDAVSIEILGGGKYEIGVHIADVSHYVKADTPLDKEAAERAFSVYLVQKVIPMLPPLLCEELCSLNPGVDKLTYSVVWRMNGDGVVEKEWFGRSVIRSCAKLAYKHVQGFLDEPYKEWKAEELPQIHGGHRISEILQKCIHLNKIAVIIKQDRIKNGSLRLDQKKLSFTLDSESGFPNTVKVCERSDANFLIEELMLRANISVAKYVLANQPNNALLRCHPPPSKKCLKNFDEFCMAMGLNMDSSSSGSLAESFTELTSGGPGANMDRYHAVVSQCLRSMQQAKYIPSGKKDIKHHHYALNFPCYTHFTSPIRRYADLLVHRQLSIALEYQPWEESSLTNPIKLKKICHHVNIRKTNAKTIGEKSVELFFTLFLRQCGPIEVEGAVIDLLDKSFEVMVGRFGVSKRIKLNNLPLESYTLYKEESGSSFELCWSPNKLKNEVMKQKVHIFTQLKCRLVHSLDTWDIQLKHPLED